MGASILLSRRIGCLAHGVGRMLPLERISVATAGRPYRWHARLAAAKILPANDSVLIVAQLLRACLQKSLPPGSPGMVTPPPSAGNLRSCLSISSDRRCWLLGLIRKIFEMSSLAIRSA